jgi:hypothetical protein
MIKLVEEYDNSEMEFPYEELLIQLHSALGFVKKAKFTQDDELETKRRSLARPKAGRKPGSIKKISTKRRHYNEFRLKHPHNYTSYSNWCEKNKISDDEMYTPESFRKIKER